MAVALTKEERIDASNAQKIFPCMILKREQWVVVATSTQNIDALAVINGQIKIIADEAIFLIVFILINYYL